MLEELLQVVVKSTCNFVVHGLIWVGDSQLFWPYDLSLNFLCTQAGTSQNS